MVSEGTTNGLFAALSLLAEHPVDAVAEVYSSAMKIAYWDHKDLTLAGGLAIGGVSRLLAAATSAESDHDAYRFRSAAKTLTYDYASFSWKGWDEDGIEVSDRGAEAGLAAAKLNLSLAVDLDKGALRISRARWMVGAHLLTAGEYDAARTEFTIAEALASEVGEDTDAILNRAYRYLAGSAMGVDGAEDDLISAVSALSAMDHGDDFVEQVMTAKRVIGLG